MDLLAQSPHLMLVDPISKYHQKFLLLYKEAHKLKFVPRWTIEHQAMEYIFNEINGQVARFPQTMVDLTIDKTTDNETNLLMALNLQVQSPLVPTRHLKQRIERRKIQTRLCLIQFQQRSSIYTTPRIPTSVQLYSILTSTQT